MAVHAIQSRSTTRVAAPGTGIVGWLPQRAVPRRRVRFAPKTIGGPRVGHAHLDWVKCETRLSAAQCDEIAGIGQHCERSEPTVVGEERLSAHRLGRVHMIPDTRETAPVYRLLWEVAADASARHYGLTVTGITRMPHYVEYTPGYGHFHWHNDYSHEAADSPRKLTVVVQLSDAAEYQGGDLEVFNVGSETLPREHGTIVCMPSFVPHRVSPVTAGVRRIIVAWIAGPRLV